MMNRSIAIGFLFCALLYFTGCAVTSGRFSLPDKDPEKKAKTFISKKDRSLIYIYRKGQTGAATLAAMSFDGKVVGRTGQDTFFLWETIPGQHRISSRAGNTSDLRLDTAAGKIYFVRQVLSGKEGRLNTEHEVVSDSDGMAAVKVSKLLAVIRSGKKSRRIEQDTLAIYPPIEVEAKPETDVTQHADNKGFESFPKIIKGKAITAHFRKYRHLRFDSTPGANFTIDVRPGNTVERACNTCNTPHDYGEMKIQSAKNLVCFDWEVVIYPASTCFRVIQLTDNRFQLTGILNNEIYGYKVRQ